MNKYIRMIISVQKDVDQNNEESLYGRWRKYRKQKGIPFNNMAEKVKNVTYVSKAFAQWKKAEQAADVMTTAVVTKEKAANASALLSFFTKKLRKR